eukprot:16446848-Heterocapsa_arctica.AAC.2
MRDCNAMQLSTSAREVGPVLLLSSRKEESIFAGPGHVLLGGLDRQGQMRRQPHHLAVDAPA